MTSGQYSNSPSCDYVARGPTYFLSCDYVTKGYTSTRYINTYGTKYDNTRARGPMGLLSNQCKTNIRFNLKEINDGTADHLTLLRLFPLEIKGLHAETSDGTSFSYYP